MVVPAADEVPTPKLKFAAQGSRGIAEVPSPAQAAAMSTMGMSRHGRMYP